jgi:hypothetical protein
VLTTVIALTAAGARDSHRVNAGQQAYAVAEAGLNNALAVLNQHLLDGLGALVGNVAGRSSRVRLE